MQSFRAEELMADLSGLRVAILIDDGFEEVEMVRPRKAGTPRTEK